MTQPRALSCPKCGGAVPPPLSSRKTTCTFCSRPLFYTGEDFLPRYALRPRLGEAELQQRCRKAFATLYVPGDLPRRALLLQKRRTYVPFYLLTGKRGGVMSPGREKIVRRREELARLSLAPEVPGLRVQRGLALGGHQPEVVVEEDSCVILADFRYLYPAATLGAWDAADAGMKDTVLDHLEDAEPVLLAELVRSGEVLDADIPLERILEKGVASTEGSGEISVLEVHPIVVYLPLTTFTFRYGRHVFSLTLEEVGGSWVCGTLPFRRDWAFLLGLGMVSLLALFVGRVGSLFLTYDWGAATPTMSIDRNFMAGLLLFSGAVLTAAFLLGFSAAWGLVRAPYQVRQRHEGQVVELAGPVPKSPLAPVNGVLKWLLTTFFELQSRRRRWVDG